MEVCLPGRRVLVVEDNPALAYDIDDALSDSGAVVVGPALDFDTGLALASTNDLDGAVLDIDIAGQPVWPIARVLKQDGVPFVFVSADCHDGLPEDLLGAICVDKPAPTDTILNTVSSAIARE